MSTLEPSDTNGTSDRPRLDALEADLQGLTTDVQGLTTVLEGFSTRAAEDAAMHWELTGELKARLDHQDQMLQTLVDRSEAHGQLLQTLVDRLGVQEAAHEPERRQ